MADGLTSNYNWVKPEVTGSPDTWGGKLNDNFDAIDTKVKELDDLIAGINLAVPNVRLSKTYAQNVTTAVDSAALTTFTPVPLDEEFDPGGLCTLAANAFTFSEDGYVRWRTRPNVLLSGSALQFRCITRLYNVTDNVLVDLGSLYTQVIGSSSNISGGYTVVSDGEAAVVASKQYRLDIAAKYLTVNGSFNWMTNQVNDTRFGSPRVSILDFYRG